MEKFFLNMAIPRGEIIRQIKKGAVLVDEKIVKPSYLLKQGDKISFSIEEKVQALLPNKKITFEILYQDENIIAINKPSGLQVHPSTKNETDTLVHGLLHKFPEIASVGDVPEIRPGIVHRLDRSTSGVLIVARNQTTYLQLKKKFQSREIRKRYWAVVYGCPEKQGFIDSPLARATDYKKQIIATEKTKTKIRAAATDFKKLSSSDQYALLEVSPHTGRTHQIRVHLTSIGHPIVGDEKYTHKQFMDEKKTPRLLLHAKNIEFENSGREYAFEAPLPPDFQDFLKKNNLWPEGLTKSQ